MQVIHPNPQDSGSGDKTIATLAAGSSGPRKRHSSLYLTLSLKGRPAPGLDRHTPTDSYHLGGQVEETACLFRLQPVTLEEEEEEAWMEQAIQAEKQLHTKEAEDGRER